MKNIIIIISIVLFPFVIFSQTHSLLKNIGNGNEHGIPTTNYVTYWNGKHYFISGAPGSSNRIWSTQGTTATTLPVLTINYSTLDFLFSIENGLIFSAWDDVQGIYLSNGTQAGTSLITEFPGRSVVFMLSLNNNSVLFVTENFAEDTTSLWVTNGTSGGTINLGDFTLKADFISYTYYENSVIFTEKSTSFSKFPPVITDGTPSGTQLVTDYINNIITNDISAVESAAGTDHFIFVRTSQGGRVFNGTTVANISLAGDYNHAFRLNNLNLVFSDYDILVYDSMSGTGTLLPVAPYYFSEPIVHNDKVYFHNDGSFVYETDGTSAGTKKVSSKTAGEFNYDPYLVGKDDKLYYSTNQGSNTELWEIDLSNSGDSSFAVIKSAASFIIDPFAFASGGNLVYAKYTSAVGNEFWVYNSIPTGIRNDVLYHHQVDVFPNPAANEVYVRFDVETPADTRLYMYDHAGRCVRQHTISWKENKLDIQDLTPGVYYLLLKSEVGGMITSGLIKM